MNKTNEQLILEIQSLENALAGVSFNLALMVEKVRYERARFRDETIEEMLLNVEEQLKGGK